jgi:hypothetical protein
MDNIINAVLEYIQEKIYPITFKHILYLGIITLISSHITSYFLNFRLLKWIYIGTIIVTIANLYNQGETDASVATKDIFKLATI